MFGSIVQNITVDRLQVNGMKRTTGALIAALIAISMPAFAADKTDIVIFVNGDRLTGEFKSLERGRLRFKTAATDTISIEWDDVAFLKSDQNIQVETEGGDRYLGHLSASTREKRIIVETGSGPIDLEIARVILMTPIEERGLDRIDGWSAVSFLLSATMSMPSICERRLVLAVVGYSASQITVHYRS